MKASLILSFSFFIILFIGETILANPIFKKHLDTNMNQSKDTVCDTTGFFDSNTAVTFFGDSRIDFVSDLIYGAASLDHYLSTKGTWNVQIQEIQRVEQEAEKKRLEALAEYNRQQEPLVLPSEVLLK